MSTELETGSDLDPAPKRALVPALKRETILPSSDRGRLAAIVATCSLAGLAGGMALSMLAETHRAVEASRAAARAAMSHEPRTWLGLGIKDMSPHNCDGAIVTEVTAGSPAAKAGFRSADVVMSFSGDRVCGMDHLVDVVRASLPGAVPEMRVRRGTEELVLHPTLGIMPDQIRDLVVR